MAGETVHNFGGSTYYNTITKDSNSIFTLQWSDPMGASSNDYDLYLLNPARTIIVDWSADVQTGTQDPFEWISGGGGFYDGYVLVVVLNAGGKARYLQLNAQRGCFKISTDGQTYGHSAAASALPPRSKAGKVP